MAKGFMGIKHPGLMHEATGTPQGSPIPPGKLDAYEAKMKKSGRYDRTVAARIALARRAHKPGGLAEN